MKRPESSRMLREDPLNLIFRVIPAKGTANEKQTNLQSGHESGPFQLPPGRHMLIKLNGEPHESQDSVTVSCLLSSLGIAGGRVAVEVNLSVVKKCDYETRELREGDQVEIVNFVGGG